VTAKARPLRAVAKGETAPRRQRTKTVRAAAATGVRRELLVALRARIARDIDDPNTPARDLASLSRRLLEVAKEIEVLDSRDEGDDVGQAASTGDRAFTSEAL
jgi:signal transduction histidine kinase